MVIALAMKSWFGPLFRLRRKRQGIPGWVGGETRPLAEPETGRPVAGSRGTADAGTSPGIDSTRPTFVALHSFSHGWRSCKVSNSTTNEHDFTRISIRVDSRSFVANLPITVSSTTVPACAGEISPSSVGQP